MASACALAMFSGKIFIISRLSRSAERSKRIFTGGVVAANGICSAAFCESAALGEKYPLSLCYAKPAPPRGRLMALLETLPPPPKAVPLGKVA